MSKILRKGEEEKKERRERGIWSLFKTKARRERLGHLY